MTLYLRQRLKSYFNSYRFWLDKSFKLFLNQGSKTDYFTILQCLQLANTSIFDNFLNEK